MSRKGPMRGSKTAAIAGAATGVVVGGLIDLRLAFNVRCQPSCGGVDTMMALSAIGIPVQAAATDCDLSLPDVRSAEIIRAGDDLELAARGASPSSHRERRGAPMARRDD